MDKVKNYPCILENVGSSCRGSMHITIAIMARDYKGLNNRGSNGVLVKRKVHTNDGTQQVDKLKT